MRYDITRIPYHLFISDAFAYKLKDIIFIFRHT